MKNEELSDDTHLLKKGIKQYILGHISQVAIWIPVTLTSWRSESSNMSLVILDKLLFGCRSRNLLEKWIKQYQFGNIRQVEICRKS